MQDDKAIIAYSLNKKLSQWLQRQFKKMASLENSKENMPEAFTEAMKEFLSRISSMVDIVEG